jgi:hypothetical protein
MPLIQIVVALCIVGLVLWVVQQIPMDPTIAKIIRVVVIVVVCLWLLSLLAGWGGFGTLNFSSGPRVR